MNTLLTKCGNAKKKILTIGPVSAQPEDINSIANTLEFLTENYVIDYLDPLATMEELPNKAYYQLWQQKLAACLAEYDVFLGFSFGGVILQQCFSLFNTSHKPIILFSTPTFADSSLIQKLGKVITLCKEEKLQDALQALYLPVFHPHKIPHASLQCLNQSQGCARLIYGLDRVLQTDSRQILDNNVVPHLHLIGEYSDLVNIHNVIAAPNGHLIRVPESGMRVLQDNPSYCQKIILETLSETR